MAESNGLLDFLNSPGGMGLLSAVGAGLAGARRGGTWNAVGSGLLGGVQGYAQGQDLQRQNEYAAQRGKLFDMQAQQLEQQQAAAKAEAERASARQGYLGSVGQVTSPRLDAQPNKFDPTQWLRLGGSVEEAQKLAGMGDWGRAEVARTLESQDAQGNKITLQFDKFGRPVGDGVQGYVAPVQVDLGGRVQFVKPQAGVNLTKTMTPGEIAANARAREAASRDAQAVTYQQDSEGNFVALPTRIQPGSVVRGLPVVSGPGMAPLRGAQKDGGLTEGQSKSYLFGTRASEANRILSDMQKQGVTNSGGVKRFAEGAGRVLGLGTESLGGTLANTLGTATNWTQSTEQQQVEQAKRDFVNAVLRKESGAVIGPSEFDSADRQYFPQPGDDQATIEQKARNRELAIQGILADVPVGRRPKQSQPESSQGGWSIRQK